MVVSLVAVNLLKTILIAALFWAPLSRAQVSPPETALPVTAAPQTASETEPLFAPLAKGEVYWWQKPNTLKKIRDERAVMIVIKNEKPVNGKKVYSMTGAGVMRAPRAFALQTILAFNDLSKVSPYFKKVVHQPEYKRVYFLLEAYNYQARLLIKYRIEDQADKTVFHWNVVWGGFQGMIGSIEMTSYKGDKTEAVVLSKFDDRDIPLPHIFTSFLLEIIVQQVAKSMRTYIEEKYVKEKGLNNDR